MHARSRDLFRCWAARSWHLLPLREILRREMLLPAQARRAGARALLGARPKSAHGACIHLNRQWLSRRPAIARRAAKSQRALISLLEVEEAWRRAYKISFSRARDVKTNRRPAYARVATSGAAFVSASMPAPAASKARADAKTIARMAVERRRRKLSRPRISSYEIMAG